MKEVWKKRPFFPKDIIDSNVHTCLLSSFPSPLGEGWGEGKQKKPFIHIWDEEFSPRYHPNYVFKLER
jgi:hypothetical protein